MKKLIALTALFAISVPAIAATPDPFCTQISEEATLAMMHRQNGLTLAQALPLAGDSGLLQLIVIDAYYQQDASMRITSDDMIRQQKGFANKWMLNCLKYSK